MSNLPSEITKVICYIRKSREDELAEQRGEDTLLKQRELMVREVLARYPVDYDLAEEVASGDSIRDRPVFRLILPELGHKYQAIVCKDLSRLGRGSYGDMGIVYDIIRDQKIYIITKDTIYSPHNFSDLRMIRFSLFFHREEYEMTVWRLTEGKYEGAVRGKWVAGTVPYGFSYDTKRQVLVPEESQASIVRLVFHWFTAETLGYHAISARLRKLGIPSPRGQDRWHPEVIRRMLQNVAYAGTLAFRKTRRSKLDGKVIKRPAEEHIRTEHAFEAIVEEFLWKQAQRRLQLDTATTKSKVHFSPAELANLVTCGGCGKTMVRHTSIQTYKKQDGTVSRYEKEFLYCATCGYSVKYRDCEAQLVLVLHVLGKLNGDRLTHHMKERQAEFSADVNLRAVFTQLNQRKARLENRLVRARDLLLDGALSTEDFEAAKVKCVIELKEISQSIQLAEEHSHSEKLPQQAMEKYDEERATLDEVYHKLPNPFAKNRFLRGIFEEIKLERKRKGSGRNHPTQFDMQTKFRPDLF